MSASDHIAKCKCGAEPPTVWAYSQKKFNGTTVWHVFCKVCRSLTVRSRKRDALTAWEAEMRDAT